MTRTKAFLCLLFCLCSSAILFSQSIELRGKVTASSDLDRIHIINKTANKFTITNDNGEFKISASENDTIQISAIQYKPVEVVVSSEVLAAKFMSVNLTEKITELDEVIVGKVLTGDLQSDMENSDVKPELNFYDLGIPGYYGKQKTQTERRLHEATTGSGIVPLNPILNWISGRTKALKTQIAREAADSAMDSVAEEMSDLLFDIESLDSAKRVEFFYYVSDDEEFMKLYRLNNDYKMFEYLQTKLKAFKVQMSSEDEEKN